MSSSGIIFIFFKVCFIPITIIYNYDCFYNAYCGPGTVQMPSINSFNPH